MEIKRTIRTESPYRWVHNEMVFPLAWLNRTSILDNEGGAWHHTSMGLLPDRQNRGMRMRQECREGFSHHRLQRKPLVSDLHMHHGTCVTHVPWCMSGSLIRSDGENVPGIPGVCATHSFAYLVRGPCQLLPPFQWDSTGHCCHN